LGKSQSIEHISVDVAGLRFLAQNVDCALNKVDRHKASVAINLSN
jgi:hypothetical protein